MPGVELTQMVSRTAPPVDKGASADKGWTADRQNGDFLQMLRGKQQAAELREREERLSQKDAARDKDWVKDKQDAGQEDEASGQIPLESGEMGARDMQTALIFRIQAETGEGSLAKEWDPALMGMQETGAKMAAQSVTGLADPTETAEEQAGDVIPEGVSTENLLSVMQEAQPAPVQDTDTASDLIQEPVRDQQEENAFQVYGAGEEAGGQAEVPEEMLRSQAPQDSGLSENRANIHEQPQEQGAGQEDGWAEAEVSLDKAMHPQQAVSHDHLRTQAQVQPEGPVRTTEADLPADLGKAIADRMPADDGTLTIELEPASLGKVTIKVIYEGGRASISLMSANEKTLEILNQNAGQIAGILEEKTGRETVVYTYQPEQQSQDSREGGGQERREPQEQRDKRKREQPDSFAQQLRLGLV